MEVSPIKMTRKQLYDEIWEISVAGVAKKYDIQYTWLIKQIKDADIPVPPSGYWTKIRFGKTVTKPELAEPIYGIVSISKTMPTTRKRTAGESQSVKTDKQGSKTKNDLSVPDPTISIDKQVKLDIQTSDATPKNDGLSVTEPSAEPETFKQYGKIYNVYDRETLYKEVWKWPVTEVAKRYKVSDVAIHKVCKSLKIPTPPVGYWAKVRAGKPVKIIPLPDGGKAVTKTGLRNRTEYQTHNEKETLEFLSQEDKETILTIARHIILPDKNARMHKVIIAHRKAVIEWRKLRKEDELKGWSMRKAGSPPFLANTVSTESLPRVCHILDALIKALEPLGCCLTNDLKFIINDETVPFSVSEAKDKVKHILTKEENMKLLKYEEEKRRYSWASKPNIRKYDRPYNGRISLTIYKQKTLRDCKSYVIEDKLGDIMIGLYEAADVVRKEREAREEAERQRLEAARLREERQRLYGVEVNQTLDLMNLSNDYDTACKIRRYVAAVESNGDLDEKTCKWIQWAKDKADWFDPTVAKDDDIMGKREHKKDNDQKALKRSYIWWQ